MWARVRRLPSAMPMWKHAPRGSRTVSERTATEQVVLLDLHTTQVGAWASPLIRLWLRERITTRKYMLYMYTDAGL